MNIKNIMALTGMLTGIGFDSNISRRLLQHICFRPEAFQLTERVLKGEDRLTCTLYFERSEVHYTCNYYEVSLLPSIEIPALTIQSVNLRELYQRMVAIEWESRGWEDAAFDPEDEGTWQKEKVIEGIVTDLSKLSIADEGKYFADYLKLKFWQDREWPAPGGKVNLRSKFEVSQRFYFFDGRGISIDEAYRFLQNRLLEKKMHSRSSGVEGASTETGSPSVGDKGLLQKKRKRKTQRVR